MAFTEVGSAQIDEITSHTASEHNIFPGNCEFGSDSPSFFEFSLLLLIYSVFALQRPIFGLTPSFIFRCSILKLQWSVHTGKITIYTRLHIKTNAYMCTLEDVSSKKRQQVWQRHEWMSWVLSPWKCSSTAVQKQTPQKRTACSHKRRVETIHGVPICIIHQSNHQGLEGVEVVVTVGGEVYGEVGDKEEA